MDIIRKDKDVAKWTKAREVEVRKPAKTEDISAGGTGAFAAKSWLCRELPYFLLRLRRGAFFVPSRR
jgi:hypothetical protein